MATSQDMSAPCAGSIFLSNEVVEPNSGVRVVSIETQEGNIHEIDVSKDFTKMAINQVYILLARIDGKDILYKP